MTKLCTHCKRWQRTSVLPPGTWLAQSALQNPLSFRLKMGGGQWVRAQKEERVEGGGGGGTAFNAKLEEMRGAIKAE